MSAPLLAGIDLGTSSLKVVVLSEAGQAIGVAAADYPIRADAPGHAEQDPELWWRALREALGRALAACGGRAGALAAIGLSGQMHGIVALDRRDRPLRPAILWADQRGQDECAEIERLIDPAALLAHTGSRASVGFSAPKILWVRRHEPERFAACARLLLPKDYLRLRLTGEIATEPTDASATLLFDLAQRDWSDLILDRLDLPRALFPPVRPSLAVVGAVGPAAAADLGIAVGIPVIAGAGDTAAQAIGYGAHDPGGALATISSGGQLFAALDRPRIDPGGRVHTLCHVAPNRWYLLGAIQAAGLALRWFREQFARDLPPHGYDALIAEAADAPVGAGGLVFLPYLLGERTPHMDNQARAAFVGFTLRHDRAAATRAVLEGVAFAFRDALGAFQDLGVRPAELRLGGGGSRSPLWRTIFADALGLPVTITDAQEGAALGAALMAGVGVGRFADLAAASASAVRIVAVIAPQPERAARYAELYNVYRELYGSLREPFAALARMAG